MRTGHILAYGLLGLPLAFAALPIYVHVPKLYADELGLSLALVGGILIGIVQSVMSTLWPEGARLMIYVAMAAVLLLRPHGLLGRKG